MFNTEKYYTKYIFKNKMICNSFEDMNKALPKEGRLLALDVGTKTIGTAITDATRMLVKPHQTIIRSGNKNDLPNVHKTIEENKVVGIIIGLPVHLDMQESKMTEFTRRFGDTLDNFLKEEYSLDLPIFFVDERLTSEEAELFLTREKRTRRKDIKKTIDSVAAAYILERFLNKA